MIVAITVAKTVSVGLVLPCISLRDITVVGIIVRPLVLSIKKVIILLVAVFLSLLSFCKAFIAFKPNGVAAFPSPNIFITTLLEIYPNDSWLEGSSGKSLLNIGLNILDNLISNPDSLAISIIPNHKAITGNIFKIISIVVVVDNKIFLKLTNNKYDYYIIDEDYTFKSFTTEEYINEINNELTNKINDIKNKYNVNLYIKEKAIIKFPDFSAKEYDELEGIYSSINSVENILGKLTKDFYDSLYENGYKGLNIYLTGELKPADASSQNFTPAGYTSLYENMYLIALDISQMPLETNVCHELMHTIENKLKSQGEYFSKWSSFNPKKYEYSYSYKVTNRTEYTIGMTTDDNVYFVDYYSHTFPAEDMARVFENICFEGKDSSIKNYSHLLEKGKYLKETLYKYYPSLENTSLFEAIE